MCGGDACLCRHYACFSLPVCLYSHLLDFLLTHLLNYLPLHFQMHLDHSRRMRTQHTMKQLPWLPVRFCHIIFASAYAPSFKIYYSVFVRSLFKSAPPTCMQAISSHFPSFVSSLNFDCFLTAPNQTWDLLSFPCLAPFNVARRFKACNLYFPIFSRFACKFVLSLAFLGWISVAHLSPWLPHMN